jgi:hypothetical protein
VKLFVDAVQSLERVCQCKHGFSCRIARCYGDGPQIGRCSEYELHNFGTCWAKVRSLLIRRLMQLAGQATSHQVDRDVSARRMHHSSKNIVFIRSELEQNAVLKGETEAPAIGDDGYV